MAKQNVIQPESKQLLRRQQRHASLLRRTIAFALITLYTCCHKILRRRFATLSSRENVVKRQVLGVTMFAAILATISVANVDPSTFHRGLAIIASKMDVVAQSNDRRHREFSGRRMQHIVAVVLLDKNGTAKPQAYGSSDTYGTKRFVRKIQ